MKEFKNSILVLLSIIIIASGAIFTYQHIKNEIKNRHELGIKEGFILAQQECSIEKEQLREKSYNKGVTDGKYIAEIECKSQKEKAYNKGYNISSQKSSKLHDEEILKLKKAHRTELVQIQLKYEQMLSDSMASMKEKVTTDFDIVTKQFQRKTLSQLTAIRNTNKNISPSAIKMKKARVEAAILADQIMITVITVIIMWFLQGIFRRLFSKK